MNGKNMFDIEEAVTTIKDLSEEMRSMLADGTAGKEMIIDAVIDKINSKAWLALIAIERIEKGEANAS